MDSDTRRDEWYNYWDLFPNRCTIVHRLTDTNNDNRIVIEVTVQKGYREGDLPSAHTFFIVITPNGSEGNGVDKLKEYLSRVAPDAVASLVASGRFGSLYCKLARGERVRQKSWLLVLLETGATGFFKHGEPAARGTPIELSFDCSNVTLRMMFENAPRPSCGGAETYEVSLSGGTIYDFPGAGVSISELPPTPEYPLVWL